MSAITNKSNKPDIYAAYLAAQDRIEQLERNAEDDRRRIGVMMYEANQLQHRVNELESEVEDLSSQLSDINEDELTDTIESQRDIIKAQAERIKLLSHKVAAQPKSALPAAPKKPAPKTQIPAQPIASPEAHEALRVFGSLTPAQRSAVVKHAQVKVVNLGNVLEVQAKWHFRKSA